MPRVKGRSEERTKGREAALPRRLKPAVRASRCSMARVLGSRGCMVCGQENPSGMHLCFRVDETAAETRWAVAAPFQGFRDVLHGGAVLALLDDAMWYAAYGRGGVTLTAEATVRYRAKVAIGEHVVARGRVEAQRGRLWTCAAELVHASSGELLASAGGKFLAVPQRDLPGLVGETRIHEVPAEAPNPRER